MELARLYMVSGWSRLALELQNDDGQAVLALAGVFVDDVQISGEGEAVLTLRGLVIPVRSMEEDGGDK